MSNIRPSESHLRATAELRQEKKERFGSGIAVPAERSHGLTASVPAEPGSKLAVVSIALEEANQFIRQHHRHHGEAVGHKFSIGAALGDKIVGVAVVGRPVARMRDDGLTLEVVRLCTDGTRNACSFLYGAAARAAFALGYKRLGTYILASENGASLKASGWRLVGEVRGRSWSCPSRPRVDTHPLQDKLLFEVTE